MSSWEEGEPRSAYWPALVGQMRVISRALARGQTKTVALLLLNAGVRPDRLKRALDALEATEPGTPTQRAKRFRGR